MAINIDSKIPEGPVAEKWSNYKAHQRLVNPKNKLKLDVIVVGSAFRTRPVVHTPSLHRAVSMQPRIIRTTATRSIVCSTTP